MNTEATNAAEPVGSPVERHVRRLPPKVMGYFPGMTPVERLEADLRRLAANNRRIHAEYGHEKAAGMAMAYIAAAESVRRLRRDLTPNAEVTGAGTASAGLPGYASGGDEK